MSSTLQKINENPLTIVLITIHVESASMKFILTNLVQAYSVRVTPFPGERNMWPRQIVDSCSRQIIVTLDNLWVCFRFFGRYMIQIHVRGARPHQNLKL